MGGTGLGIRGRCVEGRGLTQRVGAVGRLDAHHVGAERGQQPRAPGTGDATVQVDDAQSTQRRAQWITPFNRGSRTSRSASPTKLNASTSRKIATPGTM